MNPLPTLGSGKEFHPIVTASHHQHRSIAASSHIPAGKGSITKKYPYPHMGVPDAYTQFVYLGYTVPRSTRAGPINVQST